jgi:hypothetical protein
MSSIQKMIHFHQHGNENLVVIVLYHNLGSFKPNVFFYALYSPIPKVQHYCQHVVNHASITGNRKNKPKKFQLFIIFNYVTTSYFLIFTII